MPSALATHMPGAPTVPFTFGLPLNAIRVPSGDQAGRMSNVSDVDKADGAEERTSAGAIDLADADVLLATDVVVQYAIALPSGDHAVASTRNACEERSATGCGSLPSAFIRSIPLAVPIASRTNAIWVPSGDHVGPRSFSTNGPDGGPRTPVGDGGGEHLVLVGAIGVHDPTRRRKGGVPRTNATCVPSSDSVGIGIDFRVVGELGLLRTVGLHRPDLGIPGTGAHERDRVERRWRRWWRWWRWWRDAAREHKSAENKGVPPSVPHGVDLLRAQPMAVTRTWSVPSGFMVQMLPSRAKAIRFSCGNQVMTPAPSASSTGFVPSALISHAPVVSSASLAVERDLGAVERPRGPDVVRFVVVEIERTERSRLPEPSTLTMRM